MSTVAEDIQRISVVFDRIDELDQVAYSHPEQDDRCQRLLDVAEATLAEEAPIRPTVAANLLGVDARTVREWADNGVLTITARRPRLLLDASSVYEVSRLIRDLRTMDDDRGALLDELWRGLVQRAPSEPAPIEPAQVVIPRPRRSTEDLDSRKA